MLARWIKDNVFYKDNVAMIYGNHEYYIHDYLLGKPCKKNNFLEYTLPALKSVFNKTDFKRFMRILKDYYAYSYFGKQVMVTHGGIAKVDDKFNLLPAHQARCGVGEYNDNIDIYFEQNNNGWNQVYGHRTTEEKKTSSSISININSNPDIDNKLNIAILSPKANLIRKTICKPTY